MRTVCAMMRGCNARIALVLLVGSLPCLSCFEVSFGLKGEVGSEDVVIGAADGCGVDSNINSYEPTLEPQAEPVGLPPSPLPPPPPPHSSNEQTILYLFAALFAVAVVAAVVCYFACKANKSNNSPTQAHVRVPKPKHGA